MVNPGEMHDGMPVNGESRSWQMLYLDPKLVLDALERDLSGSVEAIRPVAQDPQLLEKFNSLFRSITDQYPDPLEVEENIVYSLVCIARRHSTRSISFRNTSPSITTALDRINDAPHETVSLTELAGLTGVSQFQLLRGFRKELGITPHAYIIQRRTQLARQLLARGETLADTAFHAGFADQSHLTRLFVKHFGVTPGQYRTAVASRSFVQFCSRRC